MVRCAITVGLVALAWTLAASVANTAEAAAGSCWQQVIRDWTDGEIDGSYAPGCYRIALKHLPEDLRTYSSAPDDINRALLEATSDQKRSIAAAHSATRALEASAVPVNHSLPLAAVVFGVFGSIVVVTGGLSAWLFARRRRSPR